MRKRDFARWFWFDKAQDAELVCLWTDLHERFYAPPEGDDTGFVYYCNQRIYSPRLAKGEPPHSACLEKPAAALRALSPGQHHRPPGGGL